MHEASEYGEPEPYRPPTHLNNRDPIVIGQGEPDEMDERPEADETIPAAETPPPGTVRHLGGAVVTERPAEPELAPVAATAEPQGPRVLHIEQDDDGSVRLADASPEDREEVLAHMEHAREVAQDFAGGYPEPPIARHAADFFAEQGLSIARVVNLSQDDLDAFQTLLTQERIDAGPLETLGRFQTEGMDQAMYSPVIGLIVLAKDMPSTDGVQAFNVGHEAAHSTDKHALETLLCQRSSDGTLEYGPARLGLNRVPTGEGLFWEEAWASFKAAEFIRDGLGMPHGAWDAPGTARVEVTARGQTIPGVYAWPLPNGSAYVSTSAFGAHGLELLSRLAPDLPAALNEARTSMAGVHRVVSSIDSVRPNLFAHLERLPTSGEAGARGLAIIRQAVADEEWQRRWGRRG